MGLVLVTVLSGAQGAQGAQGDRGDPLYSKQWGPQQVRAQQAWDKSVGTGIVIGIVDSGVDLDHTDLATKMLTGKTFLGCGKAGCGNGDWESGPKDRRKFDSPHGTHVAGIAAALTGNGEGIAGVAPEAKLLPVKVLDEDGGSFYDIALGISYAADRGAKVINLSLGALPGVQALTFTGLITDVQKAIAYANGKGAVVVAAAGNEAAPLCDTPGFDPGALCVAATDKREAHSFYSNFGVKSDLLAVSAPGGSGLAFCGEDIVATVREKEQRTANTHSRRTTTNTPERRWRLPTLPVLPPCWPPRAATALARWKRSRPRLATLLPTVAASTTRSLGTASWMPKLPS